MLLGYRATEGCLDSVLLPCAGLWPSDCDGPTGIPADLVATPGVGEVKSTGANTALHV